MTQAAVHSPSRPFNPWLFLALPLGLAALLLAFEPVTLDLALANLMYDPGAGFIGRHSWFLENILHDRVKQLVIAISVLGLLVSIAGLFHRPWRALSRPLAYVFLAMSLAASIVTPLKALTAVQCPWSLAQFGGEAIGPPLDQRVAAIQAAFESRYIRRPNSRTMHPDRLDAPPLRVDAFAHLTTQRT